MLGSVAVLGATSQLASDYVEQEARVGSRELVLYARDPAAVKAMLFRRGLAGRYPARSLDDFGDGPLAAIVNFIGVGDPARAISLGAGIFEATRRWDDGVLDYLHASPTTRYIFMSSGAAYGDVFDQPVSAFSAACFPINALGPRNWYALAKLSAEARHRAQAHLSIIDLRIFNYISRTQDPKARFLMTDMIRAVAERRRFETSDASLTRDYLDPPALRALIEACLAAPAGTNAPADAYTRAPISKPALLDLMAGSFGLDYEIVADPDVTNATGAKPCYYSTDRTAAAWGYVPPHSSADAIFAEAGAMIEALRRDEA